MGYSPWGRKESDRTELLHCLSLRYMRGHEKTTVHTNQKNTHIIPSHPKYCLFFLFWPQHMACGILIPWPGIKPTSPTLGVWSLNHWTARKIPPILSCYPFLHTIDAWLLILNYFSPTIIWHQWQRGKWMSWDLNTNHLKTDSYYLEEFGNLKSKKWTQFYLFIYLFIYV